MIPQSAVFVQMWYSKVAMEGKSVMPMSIQVSIYRNIAGRQPSLGEDMAVANVELKMRHS